MKEIEKNIKELLKKDKYIQSIGRRKTARAIARLYEMKKNKKNANSLPDLIVNLKSYKDFFKVPDLQRNLENPLKAINIGEDLLFVIKCSGGGVAGQSEAARLAISRALVKLNIDNKNILKKLGFLKRDPRKVERKKWGRVKSRKKPQWQKR